MAAVPAAREERVSPASLPFFLMHLLPLGALWTGARPIDWVVCAVLYGVRMFGITAGFHRYFAHRSYRTSRPFAFLLAWLGTSSAQKGVLWWAGHHRHHHKHSDTELDIHSPVQRGFWWSHVGWILATRYDETPEDSIRDFARFPELRWLNRHHLVPPTLLGIATWALFGWSGLFIGFGLSTVLLWHGTFTVNSLVHVFGTRRYATSDQSRNNWFVALITLGEGWHNNHHYYQVSARQGFYWWELDLSYYLLRALERVGLVRSLRVPSERVLNANRVDPRPPRPAPLPELDERALPEAA